MQKKSPENDNDFRQILDPKSVPKSIQNGAFWDSLAPSGATLAASGRSLSHPWGCQVSPEGARGVPRCLKSVLVSTKWILGASFLARWDAHVGPGSLPSGSLDPQVESRRLRSGSQRPPLTDFGCQNGSKMVSKSTPKLLLSSLD